MTGEISAVLRVIEKNPSPAMSRFLRRARLLLRHAHRVSSYPASPLECHDARACMPSAPHALPSSSSLKHVHTTSSRQGAASKLKEAPMDAPDDIDPTKPADYNLSSFDPTESRSAPSQKILQIVNEIANLTLLEASDLSYLLKKKLGLPDLAMPYYGGGMGAGMGVPQAGGASPAAEEEKKPEKTNFDVKLEKYDAAAKLKIIKEVRTFTALGLKEAKEMVEKLPAILKKGVGKEEAEQLIAKLKAVGGTAVLE